MNESGPAPSSRKRVLVVDDDAIIRRIVNRVLSKDFHTTVVGSGAEALETWDQNGPYDVLLTDVIMPEMNGVALCRKIVARGAHFASRIIFMSGAVPDAQVATFLTQLPNPLLPKPFRHDQLRTLVRQVAEAQSGAPADPIHGEAGPIQGDSSHKSAVESS